MEELPLEMKCEIFGEEMTVKDYLLIRSISKDFYKSVNLCVKSLIADVDEDGLENYGRLNVTMVLEMVDIKTITPSYPIAITSSEEIRLLAKNTTLIEATLDLRLAENVSNSNLILDFFEFYHVKNLLPDNKKCNGRYKFTFILTTNLKYVTISEGTISYRNSAWVRSPNTFYKNLNKYVPICEYNGTIGVDLEYTYHLKQLTTMLLDFGENKVGKDYHDAMTNVKYNIQNIVDMFMNNVSIVDFYMSMGKISSKERSKYALFITRLLDRLEREKKNFKSLSKINIFFPITLHPSTFTTLLNLCPNITSVSFLMSSFTNKALVASSSMLFTLYNFPEIIFINDLTNPQPDEYYLDFLPKSLHRQVKILESDFYKADD